MKHLQDSPHDLVPVAQRGGVVGAEVGLIRNTPWEFFGSDDPRPISRNGKGGAWGRYHAGPVVALSNLPAKTLDYLGIRYVVLRALQNVDFIDLPTSLPQLRRNTTNT